MKKQYRPQGKRIKTAAKRLAATAAAMTICLSSLPAPAQAQAAPAEPSAPAVRRLTCLQPDMGAILAEALCPEDIYAAAFAEGLELSFLADAPTFSGFHRLNKAREQFWALNDRLSAAIYQAHANAMAAVSEAAPGLEPDFRLQGAGLPVNALMVLSNSGCLDAFAESLVPTVTRHSENGRQVITAELGLTDTMALFQRVAGEDIGLYMGLRMGYAYMVSVYDSLGVMGTGEQPYREELDNWVFPVAEPIRIRKTWFADRDGGTRRHTGTDIHADEGVELYACTDEMVLSVGWEDKSGYYVYTVNEQGTEFIYCHMVEESDFLSPGDYIPAGGLVGFVGNTGNSAVNHLHLSVVLRDGSYLDPYPYLVNAHERQKND